MPSEPEDPIAAALMDLIRLGRSLINKREPLPHPWDRLRHFRNRFHHYVRVIFDEVPQEVRTLEVDRFLAFDEMTDEDRSSLSPYALDIDDYGPRAELEGAGIPGKLDFDDVGIRRAIRWLQVMVDRLAVVAHPSRPALDLSPSRRRKIGAYIDPERKALVEKVNVLLEQGMSNRQICKALDEMQEARPPRAKWKGSTWMDAYRQSRRALKTWFSKIRRNRTRPKRVT